MENGNCLTLDKLRKEIEPILNDVCIIGGTTICRLVGVAEGSDDYYYIVYTLEQKRVYHSAVGSVFSLKNCIPDDHYQTMDGILRANGCHPVDKMLVIADLDNDPLAADDCKEPLYERKYAQGVRDAAEVVANFDWQEIAERFSDTNTRSLANQYAKSVLKLLEKPEKKQITSNADLLTQEKLIKEAYIQGVRDASNVVLNLPHTKGWQEITERLSDTNTQALAWRSGNAVLKLLNK